MNSVTKWLDEATLKYKNKTAYVDSNRSITFYELKREVEHIASELVLSKIKGGPVAVALPKSVAEIVAFLGVAYSGNYYTPIDIDSPINRVNSILRRLKPKAIICNDLSNIKGYDLDEDVVRIEYAEALKKEPAYNSIRAVNDRVIDKDLLYVIFTSGSTGTPKGVMISHQSVINYIEWITELTSINKEDVLGNEAPLHFDLSIQDVYAPLKTGCRCVLLDKGLFAFPGALMRKMYEQEVNKIFWVPTALCVVSNMKGLKSKYLPLLESVSFCGEVMPCKQLNEWRRVYPKTHFFNLYGPTEACDACMAYEINRDFLDDDILPMGYPAVNTDVFLLDEDGIIIEKEDEIGEICIRGSALSYGYYNDEKETSASFETKYFSNGLSQVVYHTGDLGRKNKYGEFVFAGRMDYQIKHLGHRIELGEIEAQAQGASGVEHVAVVYDDDKDKIIMFYVGGLGAREVSSYLKDKIPEYMMPSQVLLLKRMPVNNNGKVDRKKILELYKKGEIGIS